MRKIYLKGALILVFLLALLYPAYRLIQESAENRNSATENKQTDSVLPEIPKTEVKTAALKENTAKPVTIKGNYDRLAVSFEKGVLESSYASDRSLYLLVQPEQASRKLPQFSLLALKEGDKNKREAVEKTGGATEQIIFSSEASAADKDYYQLKYDYSAFSSYYAPSSFVFRWFNPETNEWDELETVNDKTKQLITARVGHFSEFDISAQKAEVFAPTIKSWETSIYTGSATYGQSLETLPGIGGLAPSLSVNYNSNRANALFDDQKGSWLGPGWDMTLPEIRFDSYEIINGVDCTNGKGSRKVGPQYSLILNGTEEPLIWIGYAEQNPPYTHSLFISKSGNIKVVGTHGFYDVNHNVFGSSCRNHIITKWEVESENGVKYTFLVRTKGGETGNVYDSSAANREIQGVLVPSRYRVTEITDNSGNKINFDYQVPEGEKVAMPDESSPNLNTNRQHYLSNYPFVIWYNNRKNAVLFTVKDKPSAPPKPADGDQAGREKNFERSLLSRVEVFSDATNPEAIFRTYRFIFESKDGYDVLKRMIAYGPGVAPNDTNDTSGTLAAANKFVPSEFTYETKPIGMDGVFLTKYNFTGCHEWGTGDALNADIPVRFVTWDEPSDPNHPFLSMQEIIAGDEVDPTQKQKLVDHHFGDCHGGEGSYPDYSISGNLCPKNAAQEFYTNGMTAWCYEEGGNTCPCSINGTPTPCPDCSIRTYVWQGSFVSWEKNKAPFISMVKNGYGGAVVFTYNNLINQNWKVMLNRHVVAKRETYAEGEDASKKIITEYSYTGRPNKGGGFYQATVHEKAGTETVKKATTFFYPLAPEDGDGNVNPEENPFYGLPLRSVVSKENGSNDNIYSDVFYTYNYYAPYNPTMGVNETLLAAVPGRYSGWTIADNLKAEGAGKVLNTVTDNFTPKSASFVSVPTDISRPYGIPSATRISGFLHTQSVSWFDKYGNQIKSANYSEITDPAGSFDDLYNNNDFSASRKTLNIYWWEGDGVSKFTFGLPLGQAVVYAGEDGGNVSEITRKGTMREGSAAKYSYVKYERAQAYLDLNFISLPKETFISGIDIAVDNYVSPSFPVDESEKWNFTKNTYDNGAAPLRGLLTETILKNTKAEAGRITSPDIFITKTAYDDFGNVLSQTSPAWNDTASTKGIKTTTTYYAPSDNKVYANILPKEVTVEDKQAKVYSRTTTVFNDISWQPVSMTDINGVTAKIEYDCRGRLQKTYKPDPVTGAVGTIPSETYYYFDYQGENCGLGSVGNLPHLRTKTRISSSSSDTNYQYADLISNGLGIQKQTRILKTKVEGELRGLVSETSYNNRGLKEWDSLPAVVAPVDVVDASPVPTYLSGVLYEKTLTSYDDLGRPVIVTDPLGQKTKTEYTGLTTKIIDANNFDKTNPTYSTSTIDGFGRMVRSVTANITSGGRTYGLAVYPTYDLMDNVVISEKKECANALCPLGESETLILRGESSFDRIGRKWQVKDPDLGNWKYGYDLSGNIVKQTDAKNQTLTYEYDSLNRLVKKIYPGNARGGLTTIRDYVENIYDTDGTNVMIGKKLKMLDTTGYTQYWYDKRGRLVRDKKAVDKRLMGGTGEEIAETSYEYFESDALKATLLPTGERVEQQINEFGQLVGINGETAYLSSAEPPIYNKFGAMIKSRLGNGLQSAMEYDTLGRIRRICVATDCASGNNKLMDYTYPSRDSVGNILQIRNTVADTASAFDLTYTYDSIYQLESAGGTYTASYDYDVLQNMLSKTEGPETVAMQYNDADHKHAPKTVNGFTYQYDANGNLVEDEKREYVWDYDNKPVKITMKTDGTVTEYAYDGDGNRVLKKVIDPAIQVTPTPGEINWDLNGDGNINILDVIYLLTRFLAIPGTADVNGDNKVNTIDFVLQQLSSIPRQPLDTVSSPTLTETSTSLAAPSPTISATDTPAPSLAPTSDPAATGTPADTSTPAPTL